MEKNILITGRPGIGKTTAIVRIAQALGRQPSIPLAGFFTEEIRRGNHRVGFAIQTLNGRSGILASTERREGPPRPRAHGEGPRVGKYRVDIASFESTVLEALDPDRTKAEAFLVDEIGKMECYSKPFVAAVKRLLDSRYVTIITVAAKGGGLIADVKRRKDVEIIELTPQNRDALPEQVDRRVRKILTSGRRKFLL